MATGSPHSPEGAAVLAARTIALQMLEERGRGAVLVGVARVDTAIEHLLQAAMTPEEQAAQWPHLQPWQRNELERWHRGQTHALMEGLPPPSDPQPWPDRPE